MVTPFQIYRHFKGNLYLVISVALSESALEPTVVYLSLQGDNQVWTRSMSDFESPVPKDRENPTGQKYRFEPVEDVKNVLSSCTTDNLIEELKRRPDSPFNDVDFEGLNSRVANVEYVVGEMRSDMFSCNGVDILYPVSCTDTLKEAQLFMEHNPHRCSSRTKIYKRVLVEV